MPSFFEIGQPVPDKKIFEVFFTIYGHGGHLRPRLFIYTLIPPILQMLHIKFGFDWSSCLRGEDV